MFFPSSVWLFLNNRHREGWNWLISSRVRIIPDRWCKDWMQGSFRVIEYFWGSWNWSWIRRILKKKALINLKKCTANVLVSSLWPRNLHAGSNTARKLEVIENIIWKVSCLNKLLKFRKDYGNNCRYRWLKWSYSLGRRRPEDYMNPTYRYWSHPE